MSFFRAQFLGRPIEDVQQLLETLGHSAMKRDAGLKIDANTFFIVCHPAMMATLRHVNVISAFVRTLPVRALQRIINPAKDSV
jgi:hypothetical protein